jgi:hypothetical protein
LECGNAGEAYVSECFFFFARSLRCA